jgi:light-regulated signal transduction histidine kinase (bacteriophytochrome)
LKEVIANSNKMGELIDNLLDFSRIGKQHVSVVNVNIKQLLDIVIAELKPMYPNRIINIIIKNPENIKADRNMLKQVFINLLSNAFKYTGKKEEAMIEIGSYPEDDYHTYYVKDNGAGFDMRYYDKLFGVFQRLHSNNEFEGTGVGLAIIQKIITKHDGKVWAEGKVNEGACFYISLPIT